MALDDVQLILGDPAWPWRARLLRLQGWRGSELACALDAGWAMRIGPATCALQGMVGLWLHHVLVYLWFATAAALGVVLRNHPAERVWVAYAVRSGRPVPPPNRAGRRFACALGAVGFVLAVVGLLIGWAPLFVVAGAVMVAVPALVASTQLCLPSVLLTVLAGVDRVMAATLLRRPQAPASAGQR